MATALKTIETNLAAALMARGARLIGWEKSPDGRKLYWQLEEVNPQWLDDYRTGADGVAAVMRNRSMLINVCMTEKINQTKETSNDKIQDDRIPGP